MNSEYRKFHRQKLCEQVSAGIELIRGNTWPENVYSANTNIFNYAIANHAFDSLFSQLTFSMYFRKVAISNCVKTNVNMEQADNGPSRSLTQSLKVKFSNMQKETIGKNLSSFTAEKYPRGYAKD